MLLINTTKNLYSLGGMYIQSNNNQYRLNFLHCNDAEQAAHLKRRQIHHHCVYHIIIVKRGSGTFIINKVPVMVLPGTLLLISPGQPHCLGVNEGEDLCFGELTFEFLDNQNLQLDISFDSIISHITGQDLCLPTILQNTDSRIIQEIEQSMDQFIRLGNHNSSELYFHMAASSNIFNLLIKLAALFVGYKQQEIRLTPLEKVRNHISQNYCQPLTLEDLGRIGALSKKYLSRRFKEVYGETPIFFRDSLRIEMACELLRGLHYSIGEIAEKCGFPDIYYFSKIFKKRKDMSPLEYRKMVQKSD